MEKNFFAYSHAVRPYRITAICLGNICRSPMAEAVLTDRVEKAGLSGLVVVDSGGTGDWHEGHDADARARATLLQANYSLDHTARQIRMDWLREIDLLLAMDSSNYRDLERMVAMTQLDVDLRMLRSFDPELAHLDAPHPQLDVPDPYYGADDGFAQVLEMIERAADALVAELPARINQ